MSTIYYNGQNRNEIIQYVNSKGGRIDGDLFTADDKRVTSVSFEIVNNNLEFRIHNKIFDNPTNALIGLRDDLAVPTRHATGCKEGTAGNATSDILGTFSIFKNIRFGGINGVSLLDITGRHERSWMGVRQIKPRNHSGIQVKINNVKTFFKDPLDIPFSVHNLEARYGKGTIQRLAQRYGRDLVQREYRILTTFEGETRYGLTPLVA